MNAAAGQTVARETLTTKHTITTIMNQGMLKTIIAVVLVATGAITVKSAVDAKRPKGSDTDQIRNLLLQGETFAEQRNAAALGRLISSNYRDSLGMSDDSMRFQIAGYLREQSRLDLEIPSRFIRISVAPDGQTATTSFQVQVRSRGSEGMRSLTLNPELKLAKETVHYFWIFPGQEWRVTSVEDYSGLAGL